MRHSSWALIPATRLGDLGSTTVGRIDKRAPASRLWIERSGRVQVMRIVQGTLASRGLVTSYLPVTILVRTTGSIYDSLSHPVLTSSRIITFVGLPTDQAAETSVVVPRFLFSFFLAAPLTLVRYPNIQGGCCETFRIAKVSPVF